MANRILTEEEIEILEELQDVLKIHCLFQR